MGVGWAGVGDLQGASGGRGIVQYSCMYVSVYAQIRAAGFSRQAAPMLGAPIGRASDNINSWLTASCGACWHLTSSPSMTAASVASAFCRGGLQKDWPSVTLKAGWAATTKELVWHLLGVY